MAKSIKQIVDDLLGNINITNKGYETALEEKQQELITLQGKLQGEQVKETDFHKRAILKEVSEDAYKNQKQVVDEIKQSITDIQTEMGLIEKYKTSDVNAIIAEINKVKPEFNKKQQEDIQKIKIELAEAKKAYLQKVSEIGQKYDKAVSANSRIEGVLIKFGKQSTSYIPEKWEIIGGISVVGNEEARKYIG